MANSESIYGQKLPAPLGNVTAASVFLTQDSVTANALSPSTATQAVVVYLPEVQVDNYNLGAATKWPLGLRIWSLRVTGRVVAGTSGTFAIAVQIGKSTTAGSNTTLFTGNALTYNLQGDFVFAITLSYNPGAKLLTGSASGYGGTVTTLQALGALTPQTVDLSTGKQPLCVTGVFGTSNANNVANLDQFSLGAVQ